MDEPRIFIGEDLDYSKHHFERKISDISKNKHKRPGFDERWVPKALDDDALFFYDKSIIGGTVDVGCFRQYNPFLKRNYGSCGERDWWETRCMCPESNLVDPSSYDHRGLLAGNSFDRARYRRIIVVKPFYYKYTGKRTNPNLVPKGAEFILNPRNNYYYWTDDPHVSLNQVSRGGMISFDVKYNTGRQNGLYLLKHNWSSWPFQNRQIRINIQHVYHPGTAAIHNPALPAEFAHGLPAVSVGNENSGIYFHLTI